MAPRRRPIQKLDIETDSTRLMRGPLEPGRIAGRQPQVHVPARNDAAILAGEAAKVFPNRLRAKREWEFLGRTPLQAQISEADAARCRTRATLVDHNDRATTLAQEVGRVAAHQSATDDRHVHRSGGHSASPWLSVRSPADRSHQPESASASREEHMTTACDILILGTGPFAQRIACDLAATATEPTRIVLAGRNAFRLAWVLTAARARAQMFARPVAIKSREIDLSRSERVGELLGSLRASVVVQAASLQPASVISGG